MDHATEGAMQYPGATLHLLPWLAICPCITLSDVLINYENTYTGSAAY